jgi:hypothetical protein
MYRPAIQSAHTVSVLPVGNYSAALLTGIESPGLIQYGYVMEFRNPQGIPCFYVAAEANELAEQLGGGSHFLCSYLGGMHRNHGSSNEWTDRERFTQEALKLFRREFP